jgi:cyclin-dependent kinase 8/11
MNISAQDVFGKFDIPYPKREFLTDDDNDDKNDSKRMSAATMSRTGPEMSQSENSGQMPPVKRVRMNPPMASASSSDGNGHGSGVAYGHHHPGHHPGQRPPVYGSNAPPGQQQQQYNNHQLYN